MKIKNLIKKVEKELESEAEKAALEALKMSLLNIKSAKRTLAALEQKHKILINSDICDFEEEIILW